MIRLNKDSETVARVKKDLNDNDGYCPCRLIKNADTKCMCKEFRESTQEGYCYCGLYYKQF